MVSKNIFTSKHPPKTIQFIDEIVQEFDEFDSRTDVYNKALEDFFAAGFEELFTEGIYKGVSVRLPKELNVKINPLYQKSDAFRMALFLSLLKYYYKVIPIE